MFFVSFQLSWENEKWCGNTRADRRVFPQLFQMLSNFHEWFYDRNAENMFSISFQNTERKKLYHAFFLIIKM